MAPMSKPGIAVPLTQFIGRRELLATLTDLAARERLITLVGPGGIGKTRLAQEIGRTLTASFPDGVAFIALDSVQNPDDVAWRAASAVHAYEQSTRTATEHVVRHLQDKHLLLILDNCEHLLDAAADLLIAVLKDCPHVHVVATSLGPLGVSHEHVVTVPPLHIPDAAADVETIAASDAVGLLLSRAAQTGASVTLTRENRAEVVELCEHLDGMPLAIELAAVRLRSLSVPDVLRRLDERFSLLRGSRDAVERHQTLSALVDWSYDLCTPDERLLWTRLSVFLDGCDLDAAETVCGFEGLEQRFVVDLLDNLVAKSIVQATPTPRGMRYRMLVTIREYGSRLAQEAGKWAELRRRHRDLYLERARDMVQHWPGPRQPNSLAAMRVERANIIAALEWSLSLADERPRAAELAALLRYQWVTGQYLSDGRYRLERILACPEVTGRMRAEALWVVTWVALIQGDHADGDAHLAELESLAEQLDDRYLRAQGNHWRGLSLLFHGRPAAGQAHYRTAISTFMAIGDVAAWQTALFQYGLCQIFAGDPDAAIASQNELIALSDGNGEAWCKAYAYWVKALALFHKGELDGSRAAAATSLSIQEDFHDGVCVAHVLLILSCVAAAAGDHARTARFQGAADSLWYSMGTSIDSFGPGMSGDAAAAKKQSQGVLGQASWAALHDEITHADLKTLLTWARAEASALALEPNRAPREPVPGVVLTAREAEVAGLLSRGLSNKDIAVKLTISPRTAEGHVESVLRKLGATTRAQAAAILLGSQVPDGLASTHIQPKPPSGNSTRR